ncbi:MAG TPA: endonuclease/exonuclease/phosphatase family protein [Nocardioidaceae bacterium]|nr:endonuclease/exonuclease/phosphatase family protein [Nocardioidaceae bacterium]
MEFSVATWNLHQGGLHAAWDALSTLDADVVLVQEAAVPAGWTPPAGVRSWPPIDRPDLWGSKGGRYWSAGVVVLNPEFTVRPFADLVVRAAQGPLEEGRPGRTGVLAACNLELQAHTVVTVASAYGMWERDAAGTSISEGTMNHILDDFLPTLPSEQSVVLGGDFNIWIQPHQGAVWPAYQAIFDRLTSAKLIDCLQAEDGWGRAPLADCSCGGGPGCRHVRTYRHRWQPSSNPWQNDYVFASESMARNLVACSVLDDDAYWALSDHCPVLARFAFTSPVL